MVTRCSERMKKQRKHYTPEEKVAILRRHLLEQAPISELWDKHGPQPTVFSSFMVARRRDKLVSKSLRREESVMTYYGAKDLARSFRTVRDNTITIAEEIPE